MTKIKATVDKLHQIITNLTDKLDIANLGNWTAEKKEIKDLLNYLKDKTQPKPASLTEEITIDLGEIENLEGNLQALTDENTRLTTENTNLQTKNNEQDGIITGTTIPNLLANLEQYASKVSEGELKTTLANITTELASLQKNQEEQGKIIANKKDNNYWNIGTFTLVNIGIILLSYIAFFKPNKKEKSFTICE